MARFDSDVISDTALIPQTHSVPISQLSQDAAHVALTSHAVSSCRPSSNLKHIMSSGMQRTINCHSTSVDVLTCMNVLCLYETH